MPEKEEVADLLLEEVEHLLEELYLSGFDTVHDGTLEALQKMKKRTILYGMEFLTELLTKLADALSMRRHQFEKKEDFLADIYTTLCQYVSLCRKKTEYDKGTSYYEKTPKEVKHL